MSEHKKPHAQHEVSVKAHRDAQQVKNESVSAFDYSEELAQREKLRLLRRPEVEVRTGLSRSTIYEWIKQGDFPRPVKLGTRLVAWRESDVTAWLEARETKAA